MGAIWGPRFWGSGLRFPSLPSPPHQNNALTQASEPRVAVWKHLEAKSITSSKATEKRTECLQVLLQGTFIPLTRKILPVTFSLVRDVQTKSAVPLQPEQNIGGFVRPMSATSRLRELRAASPGEAPTPPSRVSDLGIRFLHNPDAMGLQKTGPVLFEVHEHKK